MTRTLAVCVFLAVASTLCAPLLARADEQPCKAVGNTVVCDRAAFDILVGKLLDARAAADKCVLEAESRTADATVLKARLDLALAERDKALADLAVERAKPFPRTRMLTAVGLGLLAGVSGVAAPKAPGLAGVSLAAAAGAVALVAWE